MPCVASFSKWRALTLRSIAITGRAALANLVLVDCPLCASRAQFLPLAITSEDLHIDKYGALYDGKALSEWKTCSACGFVHQNPRPSTQALSQFYARGAYHPPEVPADANQYLQFARWYFAEKIDFALHSTGLRSGRVFEVGCGLGGALRLFQDRGWQALAIEPDPTQARYAARQLGLSGVRQGLLDDDFDAGGTVDLVFSNHAFEHFADLHAVMRALSRLVRNGGYVFTAVPTYYSNRSRLSKQWMNSAHYSLFTHCSLNQLFARYGFEEVTHSYRGWRKEIDDLWHVARFTGKRTDPSQFYEDARAVQRYVNVVNPVRSALYAPLYSGYARRVAFANRVLGLGRSFCSKMLRRCRDLFAADGR